MKNYYKLLSLIYPNRCPFCGRVLPEGYNICDKCYVSLPYTHGEKQVQQFMYVEACISPLYYERKVRDALLRYKFQSVTCYAPTFGNFMLKCLDEWSISCDIITWVPISKKRMHKRGYDQAQLLAEYISGGMETPCYKLIEKIINNPAQSGKNSFAARKENVKNVYSVIDSGFVEGKSILLVDDIVTTGSTLSECARILLKAGARRVFAVTVARKRD